MVLILISLIVKDVVNLINNRPSVMVKVGTRIVVKIKKIQKRKVKINHFKVRFLK